MIKAFEILNLPQFILEDSESQAGEENDSDNDEESLDAIGIDEETADESLNHVRINERILIYSHVVKWLLSY